MPSVMTRCPFSSRTLAPVKLAAEIEESCVDAFGIIDGCAQLDLEKSF